MCVPRRPGCERRCAVLRLDPRCLSTKIEIELARFCVSVALMLRRGWRCAPRVCELTETLRSVAGEGVARVHGAGFTDHRVGRKKPDHPRLVDFVAHFAVGTVYFTTAYSV